MTDGVHDIRCFSHPFDKKIGEEVSGTLSVFDHSSLMRSQTREYRVEHLGNGECFLVARLLDMNEGIVQIGEILIHDVEGIPENFQKGDYIQFIAQRVDLW